MLFRGYVVLTVVELCFYWESRVLKEKSQAHGLSGRAGREERVLQCEALKKPWMSH
jgi:hypothetical protein